MGLTPGQSIRGFWGHAPPEISEILKLQTCVSHILKPKAMFFNPRKITPFLDN